MKLVSYDGGFGRVEDGAIVPMGDDLVRFLATGHVQTGTAIPLASARLRAPVPRPGKVICVGLNYRDHAEESGQPIPDEPVLFAKFANSVTGPGETIAVPPAVEQPDYEAELGVVIGREAHRVDERTAIEHVAGYTVCERRLGARSAVPVLTVAARQGDRRVPADGAVARHPRRDPRSADRSGSGARSAARPCRTPRRRR
jgi:2-keto-4-pentenoate hydratase/2-oxohepta-3-ene-1,7-dioic acid hydratase (catechol pathway)